MEVLTKSLLSRGKDLLERAEAIVAPQPRIDKFHNHWKDIQSHLAEYSGEKGGSESPDSTVYWKDFDLNSALDSIIGLMVEDDTEFQEKSAGKGEIPSCVEFLISDNIVRKLCEAARADKPPGALRTILNKLGILFASVRHTLLGYHTQNLAPVLALLDYVFQTVKAGRKDVQLSLSFVMMVYTLCMKLEENEEFLDFFFQDGMQGELCLFNWLIPFVQYNTDESSEVGDVALEGLVSLIRMRNGLIQHFLRDKKFVEFSIQELTTCFKGLPRLTLHNVMSLQGGTAFRRFGRRLEVLEAFDHYASADLRQEVQQAFQTEFVFGIVGPEMLRSEDEAVISSLLMAKYLLTQLKSQTFLNIFIELLLPSPPEYLEYSHDVEGDELKLLSLLILERLTDTNDRVVASTLMLYTALFEVSPTRAFNSLMRLWLSHKDQLMNYSEPRLEDWWHSFYSSRVGPTLIQTMFPDWFYTSIADLQGSTVAVVDNSYLSEAHLQAVFAISRIPPSQWGKGGETPLWHVPLEVQKDSFASGSPTAGTATLRSRGKVVSFPGFSRVQSSGECLFMTYVFDIFEKLLENSREVNLALTGLLVALVAVPCPKLSYFLLCIGKKSADKSRPPAPAPAKKPSVSSPSPAGHSADIKNMSSILQKLKEKIDGQLAKHKDYREFRARFTACEVHLQVPGAQHLRISSTPAKATDSAASSFFKKMIPKAEKIVSGDDWNANDLDKRFFTSCVLLNELRKELHAVLVVKAQVKRFSKLEAPALDEALPAPTGTAIKK